MPAARVINLTGDEADLIEPSANWTLPAADRLSLSLYLFPFFRLAPRLSLSLISRV